MPGPSSSWTRRYPRCSGDFTGFPPLLFQAGGIEMLRDESTRAALRAHAAGVSVEAQIWRDMAHVFHALPLPLPQAAGPIASQTMRRVSSRSLAEAISASGNQ